MEWRRIWVVKTRIDGPEGHREQVAATVAELRMLLAEARADPAVWHVRHESRRELVGEQPTHCTCGAEYRTAGTLATPHDWLDCDCGGHLWWSCRGCGKERVEPPLAYDCRIERWPACLDRSLRRHA